MKLTLRIKNELKTFDDNVNVHDLPEIAHYWSNRYLKPMLEEFDIQGPDDLFVSCMGQSAADTQMESPLFLSIGAGNCDTEVRLAKRLSEGGLRDFRIECLDLNLKMLNRGKALAREEGVSDMLLFTQMDCNQWSATDVYTAIIANQSLHHIVNLEGLFKEVNRALHKRGAFIVSDMIGRNGHQRWPEALDIVHEFWVELPDRYKYNNQLKRSEKLYENWDCSSEGFEGIRSQDILPLLIDRFFFEVFIGFGNVIDIFIDRGFGHNFNPHEAWDREFIDRVHAFDEEMIIKGNLTPTHMMAVLKTTEPEKPHYSRGLSPEVCVRDPGDLATTEINTGSLRSWQRLARRLFRLLRR